MKLFVILLAVTLFLTVYGSHSSSSTPYREREPPTEYKGGESDGGESDGGEGWPDEDYMSGSSRCGFTFSLTGVVFVAAIFL